MSATEITEMPVSFWSALADKGLTIAVLAMGLYVMGKWFLGAQAAKDKLYADRMQEMGTELIELRARVRAMEVKIIECESDRAELRKRLDAAGK